MSITLHMVHPQREDHQRLVVEECRHRGYGLRGDHEVDGVPGLVQAGKTVLTCYT